MTNRRAAGWVIGIVLIVTVSGLALPALSGGPSATSPAVGGSSPVAPPPPGRAASELPTLAQTGPVANVLAGDVAGEIAQAGLAAAHAAGVSLRDVFVPRPSATPAEVAAASQSGTVRPLYTGTPAPMGVAYYGLSAAPNGSVVPTTLQTNSLRGEVDASSSGVWGGDLFQSSPDSYGIQLNAVTTNVTLFGHGGFSFWTQNVVEFFPAAHFMVLVTNVWNFSGPTLSTNVFYQHGPDGHQVGTTFYYAQALVPFPVSYPWNLTVTMTSNTSFHRDAVYFTVNLTGPSIPNGSVSYPYDYVVFNSDPAANQAKVVAASNYTADGSHYNALGLTNDFELILGGPGGGSHVSLTSVNASLGLSYWDGSSFVAVPAASNFGGETGETASGVSIGWSNAAGGPNGLPSYALARDGPSLLNGLWNASTPAGMTAVSLDDMVPSNAFVVVTPNASTNFSVAEASYFAGALGSTFWLSPGNYTASFGLSGYAAQTIPLPVRAVPLAPDINLTASPTSGLYTPLWATSNDQLAAISTGGNGTPADPYALLAPTLSTSGVQMGSVFGEYNDFTFPVTPGILLWNTDASVVLNNESTVAVRTSTFAFPGQYLPSYNRPQFWFWNVSNVAIVNSSFAGGWFGANTFGPVSFDTFNVVFYASSHNLLWHDVFDTPSQGLLMFANGSIFGGPATSGGENTVWGSTFYEASGFAPHCPAFPNCEPLFSYGFGLGLAVAEPNDTIFNNYFGNPTTAWQLPINMYTGNPQLFPELWNITPGGTYPTLANFPQFAFGGPNILGGAAQGGNFWWDYGSTYNPYNGAINPYGVLPYRETATTLLAQVYGCDPYYCASYLYPGGDSAPLTTGLDLVSFTVSGIPHFGAWAILIDIGGGLHPEFAGAFGYAGVPGATVLLPPEPSGVPIQSAQAGQFVRSPTTPLAFSAPTSFHLVLGTTGGYGYLFFHETGLPRGTTWSAEVYNSTVSGTLSSNQTVIGWLLPFATWNYLVPGIPNFFPEYASVTLPLTGNAHVAVHFVLLTYPVTFSQSGLPPGKAWSVVVLGTVLGHARRFAGRSTGPTITLNVPNGSFTYTVHPVPGYRLNGTGTGHLVVAGAPLTVPVTFSPARFAVTFTESGLTTGTNWSVTIGAVTLYSTTATITFEETNGTYAYTLGAVAGHTSSGRPIHVVVAGRPAAVAVTFH